MKFTGQVRVPEVDHPGVPATIVVEEGQTEIILEGESLGRWSLWDVRAARLVSSAFSLSLDGEEITFIADEPVDFAYKGVDHMAAVWARYKSMTIPRRAVAVGRSRRGTVPSRISELREAMLLNLQLVGHGNSRLASIGSTVAIEPQPSPWTERIDSYSNVPEPLDFEEPAAEDWEAEDDPEPDAATDLETPIDNPFALEPVTEAAEEPAVTPDPEIFSETAAFEDIVPGASVAAPLRPGPGLIPRRVELPRADEAVAPYVPPPWEEAWEEPPIHEELYEALPPDADLVFVEEDWPVRSVAEPDMPEMEAALAEKVESPAPEEDADAAPPAAVIESSVEEAVVDPPTPVGPVEEWPVAVAEEAVTRAVVVDLDYLEEAPSTLEPDLELLFAGAPPPEGEKAGLLGAVRSAFARNKTSHEHQFVEAPGGIGIVRQICADCGYISIGVSD